MTESIGTKLTTLCGEIVPFYLSEAETKAYPYAVYNQTVQAFSTKEGVYKYVAESTIRVYSKDFDEAQTKADAIVAALDGNTDTDYLIKFLRRSKECDEDVWSIELVYYVKQTN